MHIDEYLKKNNISREEFANELLIKERYLFNVMSGITIPSRSTMRLMEVLSKGQITEKDIRDNYEKRNLRCKCCGQKLGPNNLKKAASEYKKSIESKEVVTPIQTEFNFS